MFARYRFILTVLALMLATGCGGGGGGGTSSAPFLAAGAYHMDTLPGGTGELLIGDGSLTQSGSSVSGVFHMGCLGSLLEIPLTGKIGSDLTLTLSSPPINGVMFSLKLQGEIASSPGASTFSNFGGTYTITGSCAGSGPAVVDLVPSFAGTWKGVLSSTAKTTIGATIILGPETGPDAHGRFSTSGTAVFAGSTCFTSGTVTAQVEGPGITMQIVTNDIPASGSITLTGGWGFVKQNPGTGNFFFGAPISGNYSITAGGCAGDSGIFSVS